jgi:hypothetical protein
MFFPIYKFLDSWKITFLVNSFSSVVLLVVFCLTSYESPRYYFSKGQINKGIDILRKISKFHGIDKEFDLLIEKEEYKNIIKELKNTFGNSRFDVNENDDDENIEKKENIKQIENEDNRLFDGNLSSKDIYNLNEQQNNEIKDKDKENIDENNENNIDLNKNKNENEREEENENENKNKNEEVIEQKKEENKQEEEEEKTEEILVIKEEKLNNNSNNLEKKEEENLNNNNPTIINEENLKLNKPEKQIKENKNEYEIELLNEQNNKANWTYLFKFPSIRYKFLILCFFGFTVNGTYTGISITTKNLPGDMFRNTMIICVCEITFGVIASFLINTKTMGRKGTLIALYSIAMTSFLIFLFFKKLDEFTFLVVFCISRFSCFSLLTVVYTYFLENYPTCIRALAFGINSSFDNFGGTVFPFIIENISEEKLYILLASLNFIEILCMIYMPETYGKPLPETIEELDINKLFQKINNSKNNKNIVRNNLVVIEEKLKESLIQQSNDKTNNLS